MVDSEKPNSDKSKLTIKKPAEISTSDKSRASTKPNNSKLWTGIIFILFSFLFGYLGGSVATNTSVDSIQDETTTQIVLSQSEGIAKIAEDVSKSVVSISVESRETSNSFFGPQTFNSQSAGTGIILTKDGLIVTNKHVIPENATSVSIVTDDGTTYDDAKVVGRDPFNDIAYLQVKGAKDLQPATLGDSSQANVGDAVIAIGNALGQFDNTVTQGIVSGLSRPITAGDASGSDTDSLENLLQTDAAINPGNSGGPLVNIKGEIIGINTAVAGGAENIGFAIPINDVKPGITSVQNNGELVRPYLGVRYIMLNEEIANELDIGVSNGALITADVGQRAIVKDSPADKAGLKENDVIMKVNDTELNDQNSLVSTVSQFQVGETITLTIWRDGSEQTVEVKLEAVPDNL